MAVCDRRTRPAHRSWHGLVYPVDHAFWGQSLSAQRLGVPVRGANLERPRDRKTRLQRLDRDAAGRHGAANRPARRRGRGRHGAEGHRPRLRLQRRAQSADRDRAAARPRRRSAGNGARGDETHARAPRLRPVAGSAEGGGAEYYVRAFLQEFGAALDKPALFIDKVGEALPVGGDLFRRPDGSWKVLKSDRGRYVKLLAENVKNPDEIWFDWRRDKTGKWHLRRRYLSRFDLDGGQESCLTVSGVARTGWRQVTNFAPRAGKGKDAQDAYLRKQRRGSMIWAREEK